MRQGAEAIRAGSQWHAAVAWEPVLFGASGWSALNSFPLIPGSQLPRSLRTKGRVHKECRPPPRTWPIVLPAPICVEEVKEKHLCPEGIAWVKKQKCTESSLIMKEKRKGRMLPGCRPPRPPFLWWVFLFWAGKHVAESKVLVMETSVGCRVRTVYVGLF